MTTSSRALLRHSLWAIPVGLGLNIGWLALKLYERWHAPGAHAVFVHVSWSQVIGSTILISLILAVLAERFRRPGH